MSHAAYLFLRTRPSLGGYRTNIGDEAGLVISCWAPTRHGALCEATAIYLRHCRTPGRKVPTPTGMGCQ